MQQTGKSEAQGQGQTKYFDPPCKQICPERPAPVHSLRSPYKHDRVAPSNNHPRLLYQKLFDFNDALNLATGKNVTSKQTWKLVNNDLEILSYLQGSVSINVN